MVGRAPASVVFPSPPGGGFEPADSWTSSQGFDSGLFYEGTRSGILRTGGTFFWQDFGNPQDFTLGGQAIGFSVRTYWDPPAGFWQGFLQLKMQDTNFNSVTQVEWKQQDIYNNRVPRSDSFRGWATVLFPLIGVMGTPSQIDFTDIFEVSLLVGVSSGGPGFDGDPRIDDLRIVTARGGAPVEPRILEMVRA